MDFFTHFLMGLLIGIAGVSPPRLDFLLFAGIMGLVPDFDAFLKPLQKKSDSLLFRHRGASHSYVVAFMLGLPFGGIMTLITGEPLLFTWSQSVIFICVHLTLDLITTSKIPCFYPISKKQFRLVAERAINPFLMLYSFIIMIFYLTFSNIGLNNEIIISTGKILLWIYLAYFSYRILTKLYVQLTLPKGSSFLPGTLPFRYFIYDVQKLEGKTLFKISRKYQFRAKTVKLIESFIVEDSIEMKFYKIALDNASNLKYHFFSKWRSRIPLIWKEGESLNVMIILTESLSSKHCYFIKMTFDLKNGGQLISKSDGFDFYSQIKGTEIDYYHFIWNNS